MKRKRYTPNQKSMIVAMYLSGKIQRLLDENVRMYTHDFVVDRKEGESSEDYKDRVIGLYQAYNAEARSLFSAVYDATSDLADILDELSETKANKTAELEEKSEAA